MKARSGEEIKQPAACLSALQGRRRGEVKPNVVLSSYETMLKEGSLFKVRGQSNFSSCLSLGFSWFWRDAAVIHLVLKEAVWRGILAVLSSFVLRSLFLDHPKQTLRSVINIATHHT